MQNPTLLEIARQFDEAAMHKFLKDFSEKGTSRQDLSAKLQRPKISSSNRSKQYLKLLIPNKNRQFEFISEENDFN